MSIMENSCPLTSKAVNPFECIGKKTLERSGVHKVPVKTTGQEKEGCTVLLGGMYKKSTGQSYKLPPFFIFKLETSGAKVQPVIERKAEALGAYATTTDSGWMKDDKLLLHQAASRQACTREATKRGRACVLLLQER